MSFTNQIMNHQAYSGTDIVQKCKKYSQFLEQLIKMQHEYSNDLNIAIYANLQDVQYMDVFHITVKQTIYVSFYGYLMPPSLQYTLKFYLLWIRMLDDILRNNFGKKYVIIYHHDLCQSDIPYNFLVNIFKKVPIYYHAMLDKIYTVGSTYFLRKSAGLFDFGRLYKLFERKLDNIEKISQFANIPEIMNNNILQSLPQKIMIELQQKTKKKLMKNGNLMSYHQSLPAYHYSQQKKDCLMVELSSYKLNQQGIPVPFGILLQAMKHNLQFCLLEGIFRKSGAIDQEQQIIEELSQINDKQTFKNIKQYGGYALAGVIKKFFTKLSTPIVPYQLYDKIMSIFNSSKVSPQNEIHFILFFLQQLPPLNKKIIIAIISFFKQYIISKQQVNKMTNYNMAVCFFPCIFKSKTISQMDLVNSGKFVNLLKIFFDKFYEILKEVELSQKQGSKTSFIDRFRLSSS